ncbi:acyl-CoA dehydrogenase family protein [Phytohabitans kaempferiae]|uniref:Acyl-CoA dehydrogenase family protein n=1 Tax=Phytohabitans kaempferiae TaxID=1620943 RepID=A0ABV6M6U1_9ACTN
MDPQEYEKFRRDVFAAIWRDLDPLEAEIEDNESMPMDRLMPMLRDMGALGLLVPARYGGSGLTIEQYLPIIAEFAKVQGGIRVLVHVHNSFAHALSEIGSPEQCAAILPGTVTGQTSVAFALTEPDHGTGADLGTTATRDGGVYVLAGKKWLITNSDIASHFIVFARTSPTEVSALVVERDRPGLSIEPLPETMGCKGGEHGVLTFDGVRVPAANLIGAEGEGQAHLERALEISRVFIAASSLGTAQRALDLSLEHARRRVTFGKPIAARQAVQRYLAEMATDVYALRHMLLDAARKWDAGQRIPLEASLVKLFGLEAVGRVTDRALLVHGGIGYTRRTPIERLYRDARLNWLEEGPPTIQYLVAARELVGGYEWADAFAGGRHG